MAMEQYTVLKSLMGEATVQRLISLEKIKKEADDYIVTDSNLLEQLFVQCLDLSLNPKFLLVPDSCKEDKLLNSIYVYTIEKNYSLAIEALIELYKVVPTLGIKLLIEAFKKYDDENIYILKDNVMKDPAVTEGLHKVERKLLINIDMYNVAEAQKLSDILINSYGEDVKTMFFINMKLMGDIGTKLSLDPTYQGSFDRNQYMGDPASILNAVLKSEDLYRAIEIVNKGVEDNPNSIEWRLYSNTMKQLEVLLEKNSKSSQLKSMVNASVAKSYSDVFSNTPYPGFTVSQIDEIETFDLKEFENEDFFEKYEDAFFKEHDYNKARVYLLKAIKQQAINGESDSFDYLMEELDKLIMNEENGVDLHNYNVAFDFALSYIDKEEYDKALPYASRMANELTYSTGRAYSLLGICYANLGDKEKAAKWIFAAINNGVAPSFIEEYIDILYDAGKYNEVAIAANNYVAYSNEDSVKVLYVFAAALLKIGEYDEALIELDECAAILSDEYNLDISFEEERNAIEESRRGNTKDFSYADYIDYTLDDVAIELTDSIDQCYKEAEDILVNLNKESDPSRINMLVDHLFTVTRMLFYKEDVNRAVNILYGIEPYLDEKILPKEKVKTYKKMFKDLTIRPKKR